MGELHIERTVVSMLDESIDALSVRFSVAVSNAKEAIEKDQHRAFKYAELIAAVGFYRFGEAWLYEMAQESDNEAFSYVWRRGAQSG